jgi:hypothetical protein
MGWSNYIVIPEWKLLVEISRHVDGIEDYQKITIDKAIDEDNIDYIMNIDGKDIEDMGDVPVHKVTIKELIELYKSYDIVQSLSGMDSDVFLLYWLKNRSIGFSVQSENVLDMDKYIKEGYTKIEK